MVAKNRSRDYNLVVYVVNAPFTLPKHKAKEAQIEKKRRTNYKRKKGSSFQYMHLPHWLSSQLKACAPLPDQPLVHKKTLTMVLWSNPVRIGNLS